MPVRKKKVTAKKVAVKAKPPALHVVDEAVEPERVVFKILQGTDPADLAQAINTNLLAGWERDGPIMYFPPNPLDVLTPGGQAPHPWVQAMCRH